MTSKHEDGIRISIDHSGDIDRTENTGGGSSLLEARLESPSGERIFWSGTSREELLAWIAGHLKHLLPAQLAESAEVSLRPLDDPATRSLAGPLADPVENTLVPMVNPPGSEALDMEFVDLTLQEAESSPGSATRVIEASGRLRVYADAGDEGAHPRFRVEFVLLNLDSGATQTAAIEQGDIQPGEWAREIRRSFPIPGKGRYQVRAVVKNAPAGIVLAESSGPTLRVID